MAWVKAGTTPPQQCYRAKWLNLPTNLGGLYGWEYTPESEDPEGGVWIKQYEDLSHEKAVILWWQRVLVISLEHKPLPKCTTSLSTWGGSWEMLRGVCCKAWYMWWTCSLRGLKSETRKTRGRKGLGKAATPVVLRAPLVYMTVWGKR